MCYMLITLMFPVIIFVVPRDEIRAWVLAAYDEGLWENGEYVLIYVNQELLDQNLLENEITSQIIWQQPEDETPDGRDDDVKTMMQSMLMVSGRCKVWITIIATPLTNIYE